MRLKLFIIITTVSFSVHAYDKAFNMVSDTIDYENTRMYIKVPQFSLNFSNIIADDEGFWICYPIVSDEGSSGVLIIDYSVMNRNHLIHTENYDAELWNTFNRNYIGSRCFIKDNLYYRIDRFEDGLEVFYSDVKGNMVDTVNEIIRSIYRKPKNICDPPLSRKSKITTIDMF